MELHGECIRAAQASFRKSFDRAPRLKSAAACTNGMTKTWINIIIASVREAKLDKYHRTAGKITGLCSLRKVLK